MRGSRIELHIGIVNMHTNYLNTIYLDFLYQETMSLTIS